jgi:hypothetical protein
MMSGGEGGWVKKCFLSLRRTALLSAEGKKEELVQGAFSVFGGLNRVGLVNESGPGGYGVANTAIEQGF